MPRSGRGGLIGMIGSGVGLAAEYREHRKQQKLSRENSQQEVNTAEAGPSTRPQLQHASAPSSSDLPPAYTDVPNVASERSLDSTKAAPGDKKAALAQYDEESSTDSDDDLTPLEEDEAAWELDEAIERSDSRDEEDESQQTVVAVNELVRQVVESNKQALAAAPQFERSALPFPVVLPQRRPRKKARGFVRAYAPLLGECSGIDQGTFLMFLKNFHQASKASPIFDVISISAAIAGFAPSAIAMAVTTVVQIGAQVGKEVQGRQRTNTFLDQMNEQLFKPAGLFAMIVKYKSDQDSRESANSLFARFGVSGAKVDFSTNEAIAKYDRTLSGESTGSGSRSMSDRMKGMRLASGQTQGAVRLPESCPLIFPDVDAAIAKEGPETFKDKTRDAKKFLASYMDRKAQLTYARDDPNSALAIPESQRAFKSKLADPNHPMYNGGIIGFVSGGVLTRDRGGMTRRQERRFERDERRMLRYEQQMSHGYGLTYKQQRRYNRIEDDEEFYGRERQEYGYGGQRGTQAPGFGGFERRSRRVGPIGLVGSLISAAASSGQSSGHSREYEDTYNSRLAPAPYGGDERYQRRSFDERYNAPAPPAPYGGQQPSPYGQQPVEGQPQYGGQAGYGGRSEYLTRDPRRRQARRGGIIGGVKKVMREDVLYLMIVNMPSEAELAEAREKLAQAKAEK